MRTEVTGMYALILCLSLNEMAPLLIFLYALCELRYMYVCFTTLFKPK